MLKHSYPGVYVREEKSGVNTISGAATSIAAFFGTAPKGPVGEPVRVFTYDNFEEVFGSALTHGEMPIQVRQFFMNGGGTAWITRIADGAVNAAIDLTSIDGATPCMTVTAKEAGSVGNMVRVEVDYDTKNPERFFNLTVYNFIQEPGSVPKKEAAETFTNLSMQPGHSQYVETVVNNVSALVDVRVDAGNIAATPSGDFLGSSSGWIFTAGTQIAAEANVYTYLSTVPSGTHVNMSLDGQPSIRVQLLDDFTVETNFTQLALGIKSRVDAAISAAGLTGSVDAEVSRIGNRAAFFHLKSSSGISVEISSATVDDCAVDLKLGIANGGVECDRTTSLRPAPSGVSSNPHSGAQQDFSHLLLIVDQIGDNFTWSFLDGSYVMTANPLPNGPIIDDGMALAPIMGSFDVLAQNLDLIAADINSVTSTSWAAKNTGLRLSIMPVEHIPAYGADAIVTRFNGVTNRYPGKTAPLSNTPITNESSYSMGVPSTFSAVSGIAFDGNVPTPGHYADAYENLVKASDIFNIVVLPRCSSAGVTQTDSERANLWGPISANCQKSRAFLIMDPPGETSAVWDSANSVDAGIQGMRTGVVGDHAAIYWPKVKVSDDSGNQHIIDPSGSVAGIYARTDSTRGVWKAPAGLGASFTGIRGLQHQLTDDENGVTNLAAVNTNRQFSQGAVCWGARTLAGFDGSGESDWNYVPVRRLALMIEESLYRGLKFAVFEPNDEPLWGQIRMAAGAFMNNLFRQGAFKGSKTTDAYYVRCDASTTTQNDINLGVVNVRVGFAPLKPAEFVEIVLRQMAGQIDV